MARSGSKTQVVNSDISLIFSWSAGTQNYANNYTPVNFNLSIRNTSSTNKISSSVLKNNITKLEGNNVYDDDLSINCNPGITRTLVSGSRNIYHNTNGTKTFTFEVSQYFGPVYYPNEQTTVNLGTVAFNGSGVLDTIPIPSVLGTISNFTIGNAITIPVTKYNADFSDTLNIYIGDTFIKRVQGLTNNQRITFTDAEKDNIYSTMANVSSATFRFENTTYSGPNILGTSTKTAIGTIADDVKPEISSVSLVEAVSGIATKFGTFVQSKSKINGTINVSTEDTGSSIESYNIKINGATYTTRTFTTEFLTTAGTGSNSNTNNQCVVIVTDKRGRTATSTTNISVAAYETPFISNINVVRCNSDGSLNDNGTSAKINASASITSISNRNDKLFKLEYKLSSSSTWTTNTSFGSGYTWNLVNRIINGISADETYDFRISAQDYFTTNYNQYPLSSGYTILDLNESGKGLAIGKVSSRNAFQIGMAAYDSFDTNILNGFALYGGGSNPIDANTTIEELILTSLNTPTTAFWYVRTMFYSTKSTTTNRTQIAYPYNMQNGTYYRYYITGTGWSAWRSGDIKEMSMSRLSGYIWYSSGELQQFGRAIITPTAPNVITYAIVTFVKPYDTITNLNCVQDGTYSNATTECVSNITTNDFRINMTRVNTIATGILWSATGYKDPL